MSKIINKAEVEILCEWLEYMEIPQLEVDRNEANGMTCRKCYRLVDNSSKIEELKDRILAKIEQIKQIEPYYPDWDPDYDYPPDFEFETYPAIERYLGKPKRDELEKKQRDEYNRINQIERDKQLELEYERKNHMLLEARKVSIDTLYNSVNTQLEKITDIENVISGTNINLILSIKGLSLDDNIDIMDALSSLWKHPDFTMNYRNYIILNDFCNVLDRSIYYKITDLERRHNERYDIKKIKTKYNICRTPFGNNLKFQKIL